MGHKEHVGVQQVFPGHNMNIESRHLHRNTLDYQLVNPGFFIGRGISDISAKFSLRSSNRENNAE